MIINFFPGIIHIPGNNSCIGEFITIIIFHNSKYFCMLIDSVQRSILKVVYENNHYYIRSTEEPN